MNHRAVSLAALLVAFATFTVGCSKKKTPEEQQAEAKTTFESVCSRCHGVEGKGGPPTAPGAQAPRNFTDDSFHRARTDAQLKTAIKEGRSPGMPSFGGSFDDAQITALVGVVRSFDPAKSSPASKANANLGK